MGVNASDVPADQRPAHKVFQDAFYMDKYEVTNTQYEEFILVGGYQERMYWSDEGWEFIREHQIRAPGVLKKKLFNAPNLPVVGVTWYEADAYCRWAGKRLPTEAEWEKAARGPDSRIYPWGNAMDFNQVAYQLGGGHRTVNVGSYPGNRSAYGLMDMAGNAWEWCQDWYDEAYYTRSPTKNPLGPDSGEGKTIKGGGWDANPMQMASSYRSYESPKRMRFSIGFRCARSADRQ